MIGVLIEGVSGGSGDVCILRDWVLFMYQYSQWGPESKIDGGFKLFILDINNIDLFVDAEMRCITNYIWPLTAMAMEEIY